jgi:hypothetical protein
MDQGAAEKGVADIMRGCRRSLLISVCFDTYLASGQARDMSLT